MRPARLTVVLVAHGSRDPRAGQATYALARAVGPAWDVRASFLDHAGPRPLDVLASLPAGSRAVVVPLLLTSAYHGRVDVPAVLAAARDLPVTATLTDVLGSPTSLLDGLTDRLATALTAFSSAAVVSPAGLSPAAAPPAGLSPAAALSAGLPSPAAALSGGLPAAAAALSAGPSPDAVIAAGLDGIVLAAAGTRSACAREGIVAVANALEGRLGLPCAVAYASASPPTAGAAVERLRAAGARRIGVASYFLAPGLLHDTAMASATSAGAKITTEPLKDHPDLVRLIRTRVRAALNPALPAVA